MNYHGYDYATVQIGEQCWFAENLRGESYSDGEAIPTDLSDSEWAGTAEGAVSVYDGDMANLSAYGRLYNWYAVEDSRGLCPSGWHIPSDGEFIMLELELGMSEDETQWVGLARNQSRHSTKIKFRMVGRRGMVMIQLVLLPCLEGIDCRLAVIMRRLQMVIGGLVVRVNPKMGREWRGI